MNEMKEISCKIFSIGCACKHRYSNGGYNKIKRPNYEKKIGSIVIQAVAESIL